MKKRNQEIKVIVHMPKDMKEIFNSNQVDEFWIEKITNKIHQCRYTGIDTQILIDGLNVKKIVDRQGW